MIQHKPRRETAHMPVKRTVSEQPSVRRMVRALELLSQAAAYARDFERPAWDFAVEIVALKESGILNNDLRWLLVSEYVEHGVEKWATEGSAREFTQNGGLAFTRHSCFVLTEAGLEFLQKLTSPTQAVTRDEKPMVVPEQGSRSAAVPTWDGETWQLRLGNEIVKNLKHPAPSQTWILTAFQDANWPRRIENPLPHRDFSPPQVRLQEAVEHLNRNQRKRLIRFACDESGHGVSWQHITD